MSDLESRVKYLANHNLITVSGFEDFTFTLWKEIEGLSNKEKARRLTALFELILRKFTDEVAKKYLPNEIEPPLGQEGQHFQLRLYVFHEMELLDFVDDLMKGEPHAPFRVL